MIINSRIYTKIWHCSPFKDVDEERMSMNIRARLCHKNIILRELREERMGGINMRGRKENGKGGEK